jgi:hypothetical protein
MPVKAAVFDPMRIPFGKGSARRHHNEVGKKNDSGKNVQGMKSCEEIITGTKET